LRGKCSPNKIKITTIPFDDFRTAKLHDEVVLMKKSLGMKDDVVQDNVPTAKSWSLFNRKKRSLLSVSGIILINLGEGLDILFGK